MKIYGRPENCSSFVVNNAPKKFGKFIYYLKIGQKTYDF